MKYCDSCHSSYPAEFSSCPKDQSALRVITELLPGLILRGKYEILGKLGQGGMGAVYKARHIAFGETFAIKFLGSHLATEENYLARFRSEAVVARKLRHPNAVGVEDLDATEDGRPFIVMEYVEGRNLRHVIRDEGALPFDKAIDVARQACSALAAAHRLGIIHRDIKPDNMLLVAGPDGRDVVKILDFGLAKMREGVEGASGQVSTKTGMVVGTPEYMSPEQAMGSKAQEMDGRSDIYAMGVVLYELVTGSVPFHSDTPIGTILQHVQAEPIHPRELRPDLPDPLATIVLKALAKDRGGRYRTAEDMSAALAEVAGQVPASAASGPRREAFASTASGARTAGALVASEGPTVVVNRKPIVATPAPTAAIAPPRPAAPRPAARRATPPPVTVPDEPEASSSGRGMLWLGLGIAAAVVAAAVLRKPPARAEAPAAALAEPASSLSAAPVEAVAPPADAGDAAIYNEVQRLVFQSSALREAHISVQVANGIVTLSGDAPSPVAAELAVSLARSVSGVRRVFNTVQVALPPILAGGPPPAPGAGAPPTEAEGPPPTEARSTSSSSDGTQEQVRMMLGEAKREIDAGNHEKAAEIFERVLKLDPSNAIARDALERWKNRPPGGPGPGGGPPPRPGRP